MNPESFFTWADLASYAGATLAVLVIVQFTKELPVINKIHTRLWAYILSAVILILGTIFTVSPIGPQDILLCLINAVLVAMAAIGGYHAVADIKVKTGGVGNGD